MADKLKYFGQAHAFKAYVGEKAVSLYFTAREGCVLAEKILRAANAQQKLSITAYYGKKREKTQVTVTSRD